MNRIWLIYFLLYMVYGFNPSCNSCKYYMENMFNSKVDLGLCKKFSDEIYGKKINNLAIYCRNNEDLCGKSGSFYELNESIKRKIEEYKEIENWCSGELTSNEDLKELDKLEKDMNDIFTKIRKNNTIKVYKKEYETKYLYKLFKK